MNSAHLWIWKAILSICPAAISIRLKTISNTIEISDADADTIISKIESTKTFLTGTGAVNYDGLTDAQIDEFIVKCNDIVGVIDLKLFYDKATRTVTIVDADGKTVFF